MLLTQLTLGLWILSPMYAVPPKPSAPTARKAPVAARASKKKERSKPAPPARRTAVRKATTNKNTAAKPLDTSVKVVQLGNGVLSWCKGKPTWKVVELRVGIAAGTANDPRGLYGRSRFLAHLLRKQLNQPQNPAKSLVPKGGQAYRVLLGKDWVEIRVRGNRAQIPAILKHIAQSLHTFQKQPLTSILRRELEKTSGSFPPPQLSERVDAYMFGKQPRGMWLRGNKRTYRSIQALTIQTAYEELYNPTRMRVLAVGGLDCNTFAKTLRKTWMVLPRGKSSGLFSKASANFSGSTRSILVPRQLLSLYQLPSLTRGSYLSLQILQQVMLQELSTQMNRKFGTPFPVHSFLQPSAKHGFLVIAIPAQPLSRGKLQTSLKKTLGRLQMKQYLPALEHRVQLYLRSIQQQLQQLAESSAGSAELLWPQLLLPARSKADALKPPLLLKSIFQTLNPKSIRELALLYMNRDVSLSGMAPPLTTQRIILIIGVIILLWLLLDIVLRRTRRPEE